MLGFSLSLRSDFLQAASKMPDDEDFDSSDESSDSEDDCTQQEANTALVRFMAQWRSGTTVPDVPTVPETGRRKRLVAVTLDASR